MGRPKGTKNKKACDKNICGIVMQPTECISKTQAEKQTMNSVEAFTNALHLIEGLVTRIDKTEAIITAQNKLTQAFLETCHSWQALNLRVQSLEALIGPVPIVDNNVQADMVRKMQEMKEPMLSTQAANGTKTDLLDSI